MPERTKMFLTVASVCLGVALLLYLSLRESTKDTYVTSANVRGISVVMDDVSHPVTFAQQTLLLQYFNQLKPLDSKEDIKKGIKPSLTRLIIYYYKDSITEVYPVLYLGSSVILQSPDWNDGALLKDTSEGQLKKLLNQIYDELQEEQGPSPSKEK